MAVDPEPIGGQTGVGLAREQGVQEHAAAEHHRRQPSRSTEPATDDRDEFNQRRMESPSNPCGLNTLACEYAWTA